jgi:hypothetical protein
MGGLTDGFDKEGGRNSKRGGTGVWRLSASRIGVLRWLEPRVGCAEDREDDGDLKGAHLGGETTASGPAADSYGGRPDPQGAAVLR